MGINKDNQNSQDLDKIKHEEYIKYMQEVENKKRSIKDFVKGVIATGLVVGTLVTGTACGINRPNNPVDPNDPTQTTTDQGNIENPDINKEDDQLKLSRSNFERALMFARINNNDISANSFTLYKKEFSNEDKVEYGFTLDSFDEKGIYRLGSYELSKEDYIYANNLYGLLEDFVENRSVEGDFTETSQSTNIETIKGKSDSRLLDVYSQAILEKESIKENDCAKEFRYYYNLLDDKRGEKSFSFIVSSNKRVDGSTAYILRFESDKNYDPIYNTIVIDHDLAEKIAGVYDQKLDELLNILLQKDEFIAKSDDETLSLFSNFIITRLQEIENYEKLKEEQEKALNR